MKMKPKIIIDSHYIFEKVYSLYIIIDIKFILLGSLTNTLNIFVNKKLFWRNNQSEPH